MEDLFNGKYFRSYKRWRFSKEQEQEVLSYLEVDENLINEFNEQNQKSETSQSLSRTSSSSENETKPRRLHRSNSFNASEDEAIISIEKRPIPTKGMISYRKKKIEREKKDLELKINQV